MRTFRLLAIVAAGLIGLAGRAQAQNYPWCVQYGGGMGGAMNCGFVSFEQCMQTAFGAGGFCMRNTLYHPPVPAAPARHRPHHAKKYS